MSRTASCMIDTINDEVSDKNTRRRFGRDRLLESGSHGEKSSVIQEQCLKKKMEGWKKLL